MQIIPSEGGGLSSSDSCRVLSCLEDGCDDAYQYPDQDARTHSCSADVEFQVLFCASNATESSSDSAADFWLDLNSTSASDSKSASQGNSSSASAETTVQSQSDPTPTASGDDNLTTNNQSGDSSNSSATAIYISTAVACVAIIIAGVAIVYRRRHSIKLWWQSVRYQERRSSDMLVFVEAKDDVAIM